MSRNIEKTPVFSGNEKYDQEWQRMQRELSSEKKEQLEKLKQGAENVLKCFKLKRSPDNKSGENLLIVTDSGADPLMIKALWEAGRRIAGDDCRVAVAPKTEHAAQEFGKAIGEKMKMADAILLITSLSRTHAKETGEVSHPHYSEEVIGSLLDSSALKYSFLELRKKYTTSQIVEFLSKKKLHKESMFPSKSRIISITNTSREILTEGAY